MIIQAQDLRCGFRATNYASKKLLQSWCSDTLFPEDITPKCWYGYQDKKSIAYYQETL